MIEELKDKFIECKESKTYKRINPSHPVDIYIGYDELGRKSLAVISDGDIDNVESTRLIEVKFVKRVDNRLSLSFNLLDDSISDIFYKFCVDIIDSTSNIKMLNPLSFVIDRWKNWINTFKNPHSLILTENEIRGLIGELIFLKEYMFKNYGVEKGITSWLGASKAHKDYEIANTWYEIKTVKENAITVKISSLEQLDSTVDGHMVIIKLEESNPTIENPISLNNYIGEIRRSIEDRNLSNIFSGKLVKYGYFYAEEYDKYIYSVKGIDTYIVNQGFPKLSKDDLKDGIVRVSYEIYLNNIKSFMIVGE